MNADTRVVGRVTCPLCPRQWAGPQAQALMGAHFQHAHSRAWRTSGLTETHFRRCPACGWRAPQGPEAIIRLGEHVLTHQLVKVSGMREINYDGVRAA